MKIRIALNHASLALSLSLVLCAPAQAERADRDKPVIIEAERGSVDDRNKVTTYSGRVELTQGTLRILADKVIVSQDADGFQKGIASGGEGGLARFRQKRDDSTEYFEGEAERIEYDARTGKAQLFLRAIVRSGRDEVRGPYIEYDGLNETYTATNGPNNTANPGGERIRAVIQPKPSSGASTPAAKP